MNRKRADIFGSSHCLFALLSVLAVWWLTSMLYMATPLYYDDLQYHHYTPERYGDFIRFMVTFDSPRLLNLLFPVFLHVLPKSAVNIASATLWSLSILLACRCCGMRLSRFSRVAAMIFALEFFMPWDNGMTCMIYTLNYVWSLPLAIGVIICFCDKKRSDSRVRLLWLAIVGFCAGWIQEGESLPIVCGTIVWCIVNRTTLSRHQRWLLIPMIVSCLSLMIASSFSRYTHGNVPYDTLKQPLSMLVYVTLTRTYGTVAVTILLLGALMRREWRRRLWNARSGPLPILLTAMYISTAIGVALWVMGTHLSWFPQLLAIMSAMTIANILWPGVIIKNRIAGYIAATIIMIPVVISLVSAISFTRRESKNLHAIEKMYLEGDSTSDFYELTPQTRLPLAAWNKLGVANIYNSPWMWRIHSLHYAHRVKDMPIPAELRGITQTRLRKVPGDNPLYSFGDLLVMADDGSREAINLTVTYRYGVRKTTMFSLSPFIADDGGRWIYAVKDATDPQSRWVSITEINR